MECWKLLVSGQVQGVGYRFATQREAWRLGLRGQARNLADGSVEVLAEGDSSALAELERWCRRGPPLAEVTDVAVERLDALRGFHDFDIQ